MVHDHHWKDSGLKGDSLRTATRPMQCRTLWRKGCVQVKTELVKTRWSCMARQRLDKMQVPREETISIWTLKNRFPAGSGG